MSSKQNAQPPNNGWTENKKLVLHRQEEVENEIRHIRRRIEKLERKYAVCAAQSRMASAAIGAVAGLVPAIVAILLSRL